MQKMMFMNKMMNKDEKQTLFDVVVDYSYALDTLDNYDYERLTIDKTAKEEKFHATYENAMEAITSIRLMLMANNTQNELTKNFC